MSWGIYMTVTVCTEACLHCLLWCDRGKPPPRCVARNEAHVGVGEITTSCRYGRTLMYAYDNIDVATCRC